MQKPFKELGSEIHLDINGTNVIGTVIAASAHACCVKIIFSTDHTVLYRLYRVDEDGDIEQISEGLDKKSCPGCNKMTSSPIMSDNLEKINNKIEEEIGEICVECGCYIDLYYDY